MASRKGGVGGGGHSGGFTIDMDQDRPTEDPEEGGSEDTRPLLDPSQGKPAFLTPPPDASSGVRGVVDKHNRCCDNKFWCIKARRTRKTKSHGTVQFKLFFFL